jgi:hypothetical protein
LEARGVIAAIGIDGPRECRGNLVPVTLGVVEGICRVLFIKGVIGPMYFFLTGTAPEASDSGGEGGDVWIVDVSDLAGGGVDIEGDDGVVADVDASDNGEGGRKLSVESGAIFLDLSRSIVCSECCSLF